MEDWTESTCQRAMEQLVSTTSSTSSSSTSSSTSTASSMKSMMASFSSRGGSGVKGGGGRGGKKQQVIVRLSTGDGLELYEETKNKQKTNMTTTTKKNLPPLIRGFQIRDLPFICQSKDDERIFCFVAINTYPDLQEGGRGGGGVGEDGSGAGGSGRSGDDGGIDNGGGGDKVVRKRGNEADKFDYNNDENNNNNHDDNDNDHDGMGSSVKNDGGVINDDDDNQVGDKKDEGDDDDDDDVFDDEVDDDDDQRRTKNGGQSNEDCDQTCDKNKKEFILYALKMERGSSFIVRSIRDLIGVMVQRRPTRRQQQQQQQNSVESNSVITPSDNNNEKIVSDVDSIAKTHPESAYITTATTTSQASTTTTSEASTTATANGEPKRPPRKTSKSSKKESTSEIIKREYCESTSDEIFTTPPTSPPINDAVNDAGNPALHPGANTADSSNAATNKAVIPSISSAYSVLGALDETPSTADKSDAGDAGFDRGRHRELSNVDEEGFEANDDVDDVFSTNLESNPSCCKSSERPASIFISGATTTSSCTDAEDVDAADSEDTNAVDNHDSNSVTPINKHEADSLTPILSTPKKTSSSLPRFGTPFSSKKASTSSASSSTASTSASSSSISASAAAPSSASTASSAMPTTPLTVAPTTSSTTASSSKTISATTSLKPEVIIVAKKLGPPPKLKGDGSVEDDLLLYTYGLEFKAKMLGIRPIDAAFDGGSGSGNSSSGGGDKMAVSEDCLAALKANLAASKGRHKQRVVVDVSLNGIVVMEEKSRKLLRRHAITDVVFIALDVADARNCGFIAKNDAGYAGGSDAAAPTVFVGLRAADKSAKDIFTALQVVVGLACEFEMQKQQERRVSATACSTGSVPVNSKLQEDAIVKEEEANAKRVDNRDTVVRKALEEETDAGIDSDVDDAATLEEIDEMLRRLESLDARGAAVCLALNNFHEDLGTMSSTSREEMTEELLKDAEDAMRSGRKEEDEEEAKRMIEMLQAGASLRMGMSQRLVETDEGVGVDEGEEEAEEEGEEKKQDMKTKGPEVDENVTSVEELSGLGKQMGKKMPDDNSLEMMHELHDDLISA